MTQRIQRFITAMGAMAAGAGAMYYLDPQDGNRRRALVRDKTRSFACDARDYMRSKAKRSWDRSRGWVAEVRSLRRSGPVDDAQLNERVRSRLGRIAGHPHRIETRVSAGQVQLHGEVRPGELAPLMLALWAIPGVQGIDNHLTVRQGGEANTHAAQQQNPAVRRWRGLLIPLVAIATPLAIVIGTTVNQRRRM